MFIMPGTSNQRIAHKIIPPQQPVVKGPIISVKNRKGPQLPQEALPIISEPRLHTILSPESQSDFTQPFILNDLNLRTFFEEYCDEFLPFKGRFVFDNENQQLAIGSEFMFHDYVAREALSNLRKEDAIAAKIIFAGDKITLYGSSNFFGAPRTEGLERVTKYLTGLLAEAGFEVSYEAGEGLWGERGFVVSIEE
jgi:hypothetical protein